jgi:predicted metal-dependent hydrolase
MNHGMKNKHSIIIGKGDNTAEVFPRKSRMAKRVIITITKRNVFELIVPKRASMKQAIAFLYKKEEWILEKSQQLRQRNKIIFTHNASIPILGKLYTIEHKQSLRGITKIEGKSIIVHGLAEHIERKIRQFLIKLAKEIITNHAQLDAETLGVKFKKITVRDTTSRWGSCSRDGNLSFSWRLIMAPQHVLEYVVAHELAHLREMNHSKKFWDIVAIIFPQFQQARNWLKAHGGDLHFYGE